jgi:hypothetical protein
MAFTYDPTTPRGKVRLLIADTASTRPIFQDADIDAFISMALDNNVKRAAAQALLSIAANEVYVQKRIRILDLSTDGPAEAEALRKMAEDLMAQAEIEEVDGAFDWAEMVFPTNANEFWWKTSLRNSS